MKEDMEIMKKNKFTKILMYSIFSCLIAISIFLMISYFGKEEEVQKNNSSDIRINQEQTEQVKDSKENQKNNNEQDKGDENSATVVHESKEHQNTKQNKNSVNNSQITNNSQNYKGKKLSMLEGLGTTGKVFNFQKEALEFGKQEIKRLSEKDKKPRQFSISKVTAEDGSLVGWTVDVFEDNSVEKVVSNPIENITENNKDKDKDKEKNKE